MTDNTYRKIAIVGSAHTSANLAPWDDNSFEVWGLAWRQLKRADRYFDMHKLGPHRKKVPEDYEKWLKNLDKPVYLQENHPEIPNSVRYPIESIIEYLASFDENGHGDYFSSSVGFMLALALYERVDEIHIYGVDLICDDEYAYQKPNAEYLIGLARGMGVKVYIPETSALCKTPSRYGYDEYDEGILNQDILIKRAEQYKQKRERCMQEWYSLDGALQEAEALIQLLKHHERGSQHLNDLKEKS